MAKKAAPKAVGQRQTKIGSAIEAEMGNFEYTSQPSRTEKHFPQKCIQSRCHFLLSVANLITGLAICPLKSNIKNAESHQPHHLHRHHRTSPNRDGLVGPRKNGKREAKTTNAKTEKPKAKTNTKLAVAGKTARPRTHTKLKWRENSRHSCSSSAQACGFPSNSLSSQK